MEKLETFGSDTPRSPAGGGGQPQPQPGGRRRVGLESITLAG